MEYESNGERNKTLMKLNQLERHHEYNRWKVKLTIGINFISS